MIMRDSRDSLKKMYQEITDLKRVRMQFEANLKALAQAHLAIVEQGDKYMPSIGLPNVNLETENGNMQTQMSGQMAAQQAPMNQTRSTQISPLSAR
jgi:cystathionine beta-lyase family protein involved in aluminum resistance